MPRKEITTTIKQEIAFNTQNITTSTTTVGNVIDTAAFNGGVNVAFSIGTRTDGTYTPLIEESNSSGSGFTAVADGDLVPQDPSITSVAAEAQAALVASNTQSKIGYIGTKQYIRVSFVSTTVTSGATGLAAMAMKLGDVEPVGV